MTKVQNNSCQCKSYEELKQLKRAIFITGEHRFFVDCTIETPIETLLQMQTEQQKTLDYCCDLIDDKKRLQAELDMMKGSKNSTYKTISPFLHVVK
jgi:hypothetical protein